MTGCCYWCGLRSCLGAIASCCLSILFIGCADTGTSSEPLTPTPSVSSHRTDVAPPGNIASRTKIYLTAKENVDSKQIQDFIEYLGCRVIKNVPEGGNLYIVEVPPAVNAQKVLPKFTSHPWIMAAIIKDGENAP